MKRRKNRAILLVLTLILMALLIMTMTAALVLSRGSQAVTGDAEQEQSTMLACQSGLDYARTRMQERPGWRGDGDGSTTLAATTIRSADGSMVVTEDHGTVIGYMESGEVHQQFRLRFNYHDGAKGAPGDGDQLDNPSYFIQSPWVSINNLAGPTSTPIPRAVLTGGVWKATPLSPMPYNCARYTATIVVEGYAGPGLRDQLAGGTPNPDPAYGNRRVSHRVVEGTFRRAAIGYGDAVVYAANNIMASTNGTILVESIDTTAPRMRTNGNVNITGAGANYTTTAGGAVNVKSGTGTFTINGVPSTAPAATQSTTSNSNFLRLKWSDIKKARSSDANIRAGTYIWRMGGSPPYAQAAPYLEYYPAEYSSTGVYPLNGGTTITNGAGMLSSGSGAVNISTGALQVQFTQNIYVAAQGSVTGVAIVPEAALTAGGVRPVTEFQKSGSTSPILTSNGNITLAGAVRGQGAVTAGGDVHFQGSSALEVDPTDSVAIYARGDVNLDAIPAPVVSVGGTLNGAALSSSTGPGSGSTSTTSAAATAAAAAASSAGTAALGTSPPASALQYQDQAFAGVIYTQGTFRTDLSGPSYRGNFYLRGLLAAFGGDPDAGQNPGDNSKGFVNMTLSGAQLKFDPSYLNTVLDTSSPTRLEQTAFGVLDS